MNMIILLKLNSLLSVWRISRGEWTIRFGLFWFTFAFCNGPIKVLYIIIVRLVPRLKSLKFQLHYPELVQDCKPDIVSATAACDEVLWKKASNVTNTDICRWRSLVNLAKCLNLSCWWVTSWTQVLEMNNQLGLTYPTCPSYPTPRTGTTRGLCSTSWWRPLRRVIHIS